jgi:hypothetical protein
VVVAYLARSALRGFDFAPDLPLDAIIAGGVLFLVVAHSWAAGDTSADESDEDRADDVDDEDAERGDRG